MRRLAGETDHFAGTAGVGMSKVAKQDLGESTGKGCKTLRGASRTRRERDRRRGWL